MRITAEILDDMAHLSHIALSDEEKQTFPDQINEVLSYIDKLGELNTDGIKPTAFVHMLKAIRSADE